MRNYGIPLKQVFQKTKIQQEMEKRLDEFQKTANIEMQRRKTEANHDRTMREQFVQIRHYFENRNRNQDGHKKPNSCRRRLFKK